MPFRLVHGHHFLALMGVRKDLGVGHLGDCRHDNDLEQAPEGHTFNLRPFSSKSEQDWLINGKKGHFLFLLQTRIFWYFS